MSVDAEGRVQPDYPVFIPTKGRADCAITPKVLTRNGTPHTLIVEAQEADEYREKWESDLCSIAVLPRSYTDEYEHLMLTEQGPEDSRGPGPARNFAWRMAAEAGHEWHWVMDDNIMRFVRFHNNRFYNVRDGSILYGCEQFSARYKNVAMAGPNYFMFVVRREKRAPFTTNTRIYSCNLIRTALGSYAKGTPAETAALEAGKPTASYEWRGRYNEDTILSLDMLSDYWATILFNTFLCDKLQTQKLPGGNTDEFYAKEGTHAKSQMLVQVYPEYSRLMHRFGRDHHYVDYTSFQKSTPLLLDPEAQPMPKLMFRSTSDAVQVPQ